MRLLKNTLKGEMPVTRFIARLPQLALHRATPKRMPSYLLIHMPDGTHHGVKV